MSEKTKSATNGSKNHTILYIISSVALILGGVSTTYMIADLLNGDQPITFNSSDADGNSINFTDGSIADVANSVSPSIVSVITETRTMSYFGQAQSSTAAGSGIIVSRDGYILTNKHVVDGSNNINIITDDGTTYTNVEIVTFDPLNDVAFLKIKDASDLKAATLGDSKTINVGQQVIAIGNALGTYQNSVTEGVVSGTNRSITATDQSYSSYESLTDMIQTDASINAGNSGGALVNAAGQVIGINTAVANGNGVGFAIPISSVKGMLSQVLDGKDAKRAYLGVYYTAITPTVAEQYHLPVKSGAYVYNESGAAILDGSPAAAAGIKDGDIITKVNGVEVGKSDSVSSLIGEYAPNDTVQFTVLRGSDEVALNVTLGAYEK